MLPLYHAAGRFNYAKSAHVYVQQMEELCDRVLLFEYLKFTSDSAFTVRRGAEFWAGTWTDTHREMGHAGSASPATLSRTSI